MTKKTRREKILFTLSRAHTEDVLGFIFSSNGVTFMDICDNFSSLSPNTIRVITNGLSRVNLIKCIHPEESEDGRMRVYVVDDVETVQKFNELDI